MGFHLLRSMSATLVAFLMVMCATPAGCSAVPDYDSYTAAPIGEPYDRDRGGGLPHCECIVYHNGAWLWMSRMCAKPWGDIKVCYPTRVGHPGTVLNGRFYDNNCDDGQSMCSPWTPPPIESGSGSGIEGSGSGPPPSPTPSPPRICHPAATLVATPVGSQRIDELEIGDFVMGPGGQTKVVGFLHRESAITPPNYLQLSTNDGGSVTLSPEHMLLVNGVNKPAVAANVGDELLTDSSGTATVITAINVVAEPGAYHIFVEADYYYAKDVANAAGPWLACSNLQTFPDNEPWNTWLHAFYFRSKECYALNRPVNMTPELMATLSPVEEEEELAAQLYDCETYPVVHNLP